jgi:hypothetical protein
MASFCGDMHAGTKAGMDEGGARTAPYRLNRKRRAVETLLTADVWRSEQRILYEHVRATPFSPVRDVRYAI